MHDEIDIHLKGTTLIVKQTCLLHGRDEKLLRSRIGSNEERGAAAEEQNSR